MEIIREVKLSGESKHCVGFYKKGKSKQSEDGVHAVEARGTYKPERYLSRVIFWTDWVPKLGQ